jgi:hypothetical protein
MMAISTYRSNEKMGCLVDFGPDVLLAWWSVQHPSLATVSYAFFYIKSNIILVGV